MAPAGIAVDRCCPDWSYEDTMWTEHESVPLQSSRGPLLQHTGTTEGVRRRRRRRRRKSESERKRQAVPAGPGTQWYYALSSGEAYTCGGEQPTLCGVPSACVEREKPGPRPRQRTMFHCFQRGDTEE
ncbi:hypothetical protein CRUP_036625 [Coryphaenoides rupestris]|nr:hypothetical protein CRUP_036625 [Coryphaenoides rupestris]